MKRIRRFDLLTTDLVHALVSENTTINLILGAMNNIFHIIIIIYYAKLLHFKTTNLYLLFNKLYVSL